MRPRPAPPHPLWLRPVAAAGERGLQVWSATAGVGRLSWQILRRLLPPRMDARELLRNLYTVGVKSFPIILVTALFVGAIMVIQAGLYVQQYGAEGLLGWGAGFATLREVSPLLIALMFNGRVGAKNTAELGTMKVTEQIDALRALAIDPIDYLVMPRFIAMVFMMSLLVVVGDATALIGGAFTSQLLLGVDMRIFFQSLIDYVALEDFTLGVYKAATFGVAIGITSCHFGLAVSGGAVGVGKAVNNAVVAGAISIFLLNYLVTYLIP